MVDVEKTRWSVLGTAYLERAVDLWQMLEWMAPQPAVSAPDGVRVGPVEASYAAAICLLSLVGFDGALAQCQVLHPSQRKDSKRISWADRLKEWDPSMDGMLLSVVQEMEILRHALAHNHMWILDFYRDKDGGEDSMPLAELQPGFGDSKHPGTQDRSTHRTQGPLQLELILTQLTRRDALVVLGAIDILLRRLDSRLGGVLGATSFQVFVRPMRTDPHQLLPFQDWLTQKVAANTDEIGRVLADLRRNARLLEFP